MSVWLGDEFTIARAVPIEPTIRKNNDEDDAMAKRSELLNFRFLMAPRPLMTSGPPPGFEALNVTIPLLPGLEALASTSPHLGSNSPNSGYAMHCVGILLVFRKKSACHT